MPRTPMPNPEDSDPDPVTASSDLRLGQCASPARGSAPAPAQQPEPADRDPTRHDRLYYLPAASHCYAIVQYDPASARLIRRVVGLFADADYAEDYARLGGYNLYEVVPATAVVPKTP